MQKTLPILGLFAILIVGLTTPAMAEYDEWDDKYNQLEDEFEEKRHQIEKQYQEKFEELDKQYESLKKEIYEKIDNNPDISYSEIDTMFYELFLEFEEKEQSLESEMMKQLEEIDETFENELRHLDEQAMQDYEEHERDEEFYEDDPEWKTIEPLTERIMEIIPMEKIQRLWEAGEIEQLIELIVSETDLSHDEVKRVVTFFEKYEDIEHDDEYYYEDDYPEYDYREYDAAGNPKHDYREYDEEYYYEDDYPEYDYREYDFEEYDYPKSQPTDDEQVLKLEQRIIELEEENQMLRDTIEELEEKIIQVNAVLTEQVKFIYEWVQSQ